MLNEFKGLPLYYADIDDTVEGIQIMSLVNRPAVEATFLRFGEQTPVRLYADDDRRIVSGIALIPDFPIYRNEYPRGEFYISFTREAIARVVERFFANHSTTNVNLEHGEAVHSCVVFESYLLDRARGIVPVEFADYPDGTWLISTKVNDDALWAEIKAGKYNGFSVEGFVRLFTALASHREPTFDESCAEALRILSKHFNNQ